MLTLSIETSCDETGAAVVQSTGLFSHRILANATASQIKTHAPYGGVVPHLAAREHSKNLPVVTKKTLTSFRERASGQSISKKINQIAYTAQPGLPPALLTGKMFAATLSLLWQKPLVPVNHIEGHLYSFLLDPAFRPSCGVRPRTELFPLVALIVSGGHTQLLLLKDIQAKKLLGQTLDDAAGEAFDKAGRLLGLPYPGGPEIEKAARTGKAHKFAFPRPLLQSNDYNFSFSGLKTALFYKTKELKQRNQKIQGQLRADLAASFQAAVIEVLTQKTLKAIQEYSAKSVVLAGGVAANQALRRELKNKTYALKPKPSLFIPPFEFCQDNAAMIGVAANVYSLLNKRTRS